MIFYKTPETDMYFRFLELVFIQIRFNIHVRPTNHFMMDNKLALKLPRILKYHSNFWDNVKILMEENRHLSYL